MLLSRDSGPFPGDDESAYPFPSRLFHSEPNRLYL